MKKLLTLIFLCATLSTYAQTNYDNYRNWTRETGSSEHIALVIGNSKYQHRGRLLRPSDDAEAISNALEAQGYNVLRAYNLDFKTLQAAVNDFAKRFKTAKVGILFYAGHGFQIEGNNYLIPVDANPEASWQVAGQCMNVNNILRAINQPDKPKVVILDACRNNPFLAQWEMADRNMTTSGMAALRALINSRIVFSTAKNTTVKDDNPFTEILADHIRDGGCIKDILGSVSKQVRTKNPGQIIWQEGNLEDRVCFGSQIPTSTTLTDSDGDGLANHIDKCPNEYGLPQNMGCPQSTTKPTPKPTTSSKPPFTIPEGMVLVEGGSFNMGCTGEQCDDFLGDQKPVHAITVSDFLIGEHEVTVAQYMEFCNATRSNYPEWLEISSQYHVETGSVDYYKKKGYARYGSENLPIVGVSWYDAIAYCKWLSKQEGRTFRLPTEAEWEYAARGGKYKEGYKYSGGNNLDSEGWYTSNTNNDGTRRVKTKRANKLGLYDMSGNVQEWCSDWYDSDYYNSGIQRDPKGASSGNTRVLRGGSWYDYAQYSCVSNRHNDTPTSRNYRYGFRVASSVY